MRNDYSLVTVVQNLEFEVLNLANILETGVSYVKLSEIFENTCFRGRKFPIRSENAQIAPEPIQ